LLVGTRSAKSSASSVPPCGDADDSSVFYNTADSAAVDDQRLYAELYDELHNKLNWLTVSSHALTSPAVSRLYAPRQLTSLLYNLY